MSAKPHIQPMRLSFAIAAMAALVAGSARAQACLSVSDGLGGVHVTCPDGRSGYLNNLGNGVVAGVIGGQPYAAPSTALAPSLGLPRGVPGATYVPPPIPAPYVPQAVTPPPPAPIAPSINPAPGLTPLQQQYQFEQSQRALGR